MPFQLMTKTRKLLYSKYIKLLFVSVIMSLIFISVLSSSTYNLGPFMIELSIQLIDHGLTTVDLSPVGEVSARTHLPPIKLHVMLESMDLDGVADLLATTSYQHQDLTDKFETQIYKIVKSFVIKLIVLS